MACAELFVSGRLCLFGEHSDWAGEFSKSNAAILPGRTLVVGTQEGVYARARPLEEKARPAFCWDRASAPSPALGPPRRLSPPAAGQSSQHADLQATPHNPAGAADHDHGQQRPRARPQGAAPGAAGAAGRCGPVCARLPCSPASSRPATPPHHRAAPASALPPPSPEAQAGGFWSYVAGTAYRLLVQHSIGGAEIDNHRTTLPMSKGLSSSAAACVMVRRPPLRRRTTASALQRSSAPSRALPPAPPAGGPRLQPAVRPAPDHQGRDGAGLPGRDHHALQVRCATLPLPLPRPCRPCRPCTSRPAQLPRRCWTAPRPADQPPRRTCPGALQAAWTRAARTARCPSS
jgi:hypothetical protein